MKFKFITISKEIITMSVWLGHQGIGGTKSRFLGGSREMSYELADYMLMAMSRPQ
jgi:hypothetical protein